MTARSVSALDEEARWLTEAAAAPRRSAVFDQDSPVSGASASSAPTAVSPVPPPADSAASSALSPAAEAGEPEQEAHADLEDTSTDALLADLASSRGRRLEVEPPFEDLDEGEPAAPLTSPRGQAQIVSMSDRRRAAVGPAASARRRASAPSAASPAPPTPTSPQAAASVHSAPTMPTAQVEERAERDALSDRSSGSAAHAPRSRKRSRRSVPSWDEIVFGAKPE